MSPSVGSGRDFPGRPRRRLVRLTAVGVTVGVAAAAIVGSTGATAGAATLPNAQAVGRFLDGSAGGNAIQQLADVVDARAKAAPNSSSRNPLEAKLLGQLDLPLGNALQLPGGGALNLGAANQLADAKTDGSSLGASGAVSNSGGVSLGGDNSAFPADAKLNLSASALGSVPIPGLSSLSGAGGLGALSSVLGGLLPTSALGGSGASSLAALGGVTGSIGALTGIVQTAKGGKIITPKSGVATVKLNIGSPALGALLSQLTGLLNPSVLSGLTANAGGTGLAGLLGTSGLSGLTNAINTLLGGASGSGGAGSVLGGIISSLPIPPIGGGLTGNLRPAAASSATSCDLTSSVPTSIPLDDGAVTIDVAKATISIDVGLLIKKLLGKDISNLDTSNFDLIDFLVKNLPEILSSGLSGVVTGITTPLMAQFTACTKAISQIPVLGSITQNLLDMLGTALSTGQSTITSAISGLAAQFSSASDAPLTALASGLKQVIDIGLNVQSGPGIQKKETTYPFTTGLEATPDQATDVVKDQTLVRAIEIDVLSAAGGAAGGSLPGLPSLPPIPGLFRQAATPRAAAAAGGLAVLALGNAAAGPSTPTTPTQSSTPTNPGGTTPGGSTVPNNGIPTGIPAGAAGHTGGGSPALPIVLVLIGLMLAGGGVTAYRVRGRFSPGH